MNSVAAIIHLADVLQGRFVRKEDEEMMRDLLHIS